MYGWCALSVHLFVGWVHNFKRNEQTVRSKERDVFSNIPVTILGRKLFLVSRLLDCGYELLSSPIDEKRKSDTDVRSENQILTWETKVRYRCENRSQILTDMINRSKILTWETELSDTHRYVVSTVCPFEEYYDSLTPVSATIADLQPAIDVYCCTPRHRQYCCTPIHRQ